MEILYAPKNHLPPITAMAEHGGQLWLGGQGLFLRLHIDTSAYPSQYRIDTLYKADTSFVLAAVYAHSPAEQWAADYRGNLYYFQADTLRAKYHLPSLHIKKIRYHKQAQALYLFCKDANIAQQSHYGYFYANPPQGTYKLDTSRTKLFSEWRAEDFLLDANGNEWVAHKKGLAQLQAKKTVEAAKEYHYSLAISPKDGTIWAIFLQNNNNILRAYGSDGKPKGKEIALPEENNLERMHTLAVDATGVVWLASSSANVLCYDPKRRAFSPLPNAAQIAQASTNTSTQSVLEILPVADGSLWLNTSAGLFHFGTPRREPRRDSSNTKKEQKNEIISLKNLQFEAEDSTILPDSFDELRFIAERMQKDSLLSLTIRGHTAAPLDGIDPAEARTRLQALSLARARAVANYLIAQGIEAERLRAEGMGFSSPVDISNPQHSRNRRVELEFYRRPQP